MGRNAAKNERPKARSEVEMATALTALAGMKKADKTAAIVVTPIKNSVLIIASSYVIVFGPAADVWNAPRESPAPNCCCV